jgi:hypothetical protein
MNPFEHYHSRYIKLKNDYSLKLADSNLVEFIEKEPSQLNNLIMAGMGMSTLFLRMGAVIQMSKKLHDGDSSNDALFLKQVMDNLRETLPSDTSWKNLWYASMLAESEWEKAIPKDSNNNTALDRFVTFRNKFVHQSIRLVPEHSNELKKGLNIIDEMAKLFDLFASSEIDWIDEKYFWKKGISPPLELHPFVQKGEQEGLPYLFQGYENKLKAKFINTIYGDETKPEINSFLDDTFHPIQNALRGGAGQIFDHTERMQYYLDCFVGRDREVKSVLDWINSDSKNNIMPIYSQAGMGKGALIAGIIDKLSDPKNPIPVMFHYCGSGMANSLHAVLYHFILQGKKMPGMNGAGVWKVEDETIKRKLERLPSRYHDAIKLFQTLLSDCYSPTNKYKDKPLVIVIDGLDEAAVVNSQLKVSDWFYNYNDKDEVEDNWNSPTYIKWIFTYRSMPNDMKGGFKLEGNFSLKENTLLQPILGLTEEAIRDALEKFNVSEEFVKTVIERGAIL